MLPHTSLIESLSLYKEVSLALVVVYVSREKEVVTKETIVALENGIPLPVLFGRVYKANIVYRVSL